MSVIYDSTKGRPNACASMVLRRLSAYTRRDRVKQFKIGMTNDPERRFRTAYARNYHEMVVLYETSSIENVSVLEAELVEHNKDHADNVIAGGGGAVGEPPYFLYVVLKYKITKLLGWELARVQRK